MMNTAQDAITREAQFQNDILDQMQSQGWLLGESNKYINSNLEDSENA
ncbi:hypothetical protein [Agarivorans sp. DSG3-1]